MKTKKLWIGFGLELIISFATLGYFGSKIYSKAQLVSDNVISELIG